MTQHKNQPSSTFDHVLQSYRDTFTKEERNQFFQTIAHTLEVEYARPNDTASDARRRLVQFLRDNGFELDCIELVLEAVFKGYLRIVPTAFGLWKKELVASSGHEHLMEWVRQFDMRADEIEQIQLLKDVKRNCDPWPPTTLSTAAICGQLNVIRWARAKGCPWVDEDVCVFAAIEGHLHIIQYAHANGCPWNERVCACAASLGHLNIVIWLHENGCPWDAETCTRAARNGNLDVLRYARENGCPWNAWAIHEAKIYHRQHILEYLRANGCPEDYEGVKPSIPTFLEMAGAIMIVLIACLAKTYFITQDN